VARSAHLVAIRGLPEADLIEDVQAPSANFGP